MLVLRVLCLLHVDAVQLVSPMARRCVFCFHPGRDKRQIVRTSQNRY